MTMRGLLHALAYASLIVLPAAADAGDRPEFSVPVWEGAYQPRGVDERGVWQQADEFERELRDSDLVIRDEALNAYVKSVLCRTVGDVRCGNVRLYLVRSPYFNASMSPNGTMTVNSGTLLRLRNEAELASVLGHEFAHFEERHTLAGFRNRRTGSDLLAWAALAGAAAARWGSTSYTNYRDLRLTVYGGLARYDRNQETEADALGFAYIAAADYRPAAAADVWRAVMNEADRSAEGRKQRSHRYDNVAFFASHPTNLDRADLLSALANRVQGGEYEGAKAYQEALVPWIPVFLEDQLALNDFGGTEYLISRLAGGEPLSPALSLARAELYRNRGNPRDLQDAIGFYRDALSGDATLSTAWRGLGISLLRAGQSAEGRDAIATYLKANPDAADAPMLRSMIGN